MPDYPQSPDQKSKKHCTRTVRGIFYWSLVKEFASTGLRIFSILMGIVVFTQLIKLLGESVSGALAVDGVMVILGFSALSFIPVLLSISLFLSVLLTLTRVYRDSEMVVWFSSGVGLTRFIRPVMAYTLPVVTVIALLSLVLSPWIWSMADEFKRRLNSRDDVSSAAPGVFRESKQADRVFFLEEVDVEKKRVANIFVQSVQNGKDGTMVAKEGYQEIAANGDRFLVLLNGSRYEGIPGRADFKIAEFERYSIRIEPVELPQETHNRRAYSTLYLIQHPDPLNQSQLVERISLPLGALMLALLAIPLSYVNPRAGRSFSMIAAIVIYMFYNNMSTIAVSWVAREKVGMLVGLWGIHLVLLVGTIVYFYHRSSPFSWQRWRR
ncbi:MAG: LPS export ABC transporter permease LptF [Sideroxydans sp.]|nr:LPS export ABC transporter permease LptF [Sideroxydans sp.]